MPLSVSSEASLNSRANSRATSTGFKVAQSIEGAHARHGSCSPSPDVMRDTNCDCDTTLIGTGPGLAYAEDMLTISQSSAREDAPTGTPSSGKRKVCASSQSSSNSAYADHMHSVMRLSPGPRRPLLLPREPQRVCSAYAQAMLNVY